MSPNNKLVLYDHQIFAIQSFGGVSKYFLEIMKHTDPELWDVCVAFSNNKYLNDKGIGKKIPHLNFFKSRTFRGRIWRMMLELGKPYSLYKIAKENYRVLHLTHYDAYAVGIVRRPVVVTYHDKIHSTYCYNPRLVREQKKSLARADKIIAISNQTRKDLLSLFDVDEKKIEVIYHGVNENIYAPKARIIEGKYILYVGWRSNYKNFPRFLEAYSRIVKREIPELKLVCTGPSFDNNELLKMQALGIKEGQVNVKYYPDEDMQNLYQNAELFAFPSENEGFGLPLLEAMKNNCPVVCSNASCFPEIAGEAAEYFNPLDVDDIFTALKKVLFSNDMRKRLIEKGQERCKAFTWEESARKHINLYKSLC